MCAMDAAHQTIISATETQEKPKEDGKQWS